MRVRPPHVAADRGRSGDAAAHPYDSQRFRAVQSALRGQIHRADRRRPARGRTATHEAYLAQASRQECAGPSRESGQNVRARQHTSCRSGSSRAVRARRESHHAAIALLLRALQSTWTRLLARVAPEASLHRQMRRRRRKRHPCGSPQCARAPGRRAKGAAWTGSSEAQRADRRGHPTACRTERVSRPRRQPERDSPTARECGAKRATEPARRHASVRVRQRGECSVVRTKRQQCRVFPRWLQRSIQLSRRTLIS
ncbi:hypothetical protein QFZ94_002141 [Paraburkholderia sp. JPY465]